MNKYPVIKKCINGGLKFLGSQRQIWVNLDLNPGVLIKGLISYVAMGPSYYFNAGFCRPNRVHIYLTGKCNLRCRHCDVWKTSKGEGELTAQEWKRIISGLAGWIIPRHIHFTGGEPLMRDDFIEIVKFAGKNKITASVNTNGILINKELAKEMIGAGLAGIAISIDGFSATHDYLRGEKGVFEKASKAIEYLDGAIPVIIATVLSGYNQKEVIDLARWAREKGCAGILFQALFQNPNGGSDPRRHENSDLWPQDINDMDSVIDGLARLKREGMPVLNSVRQLELMKAYFRDPLQISSLYKCKVGVSNLVVDSYGKAGFCGNIGPIGDLKHFTPRELWNSKEARSARIKVKNCAKNCRIMNCNNL